MRAMAQAERRAGAPAAIGGTVSMELPPLSVAAMRAGGARIVKEGLPSGRGAPCGRVPAGAAGELGFTRKHPPGLFPGPTLA